jgi:hypothetical protein
MSGEILPSTYTPDSYLYVPNVEKEAFSEVCIPIRANP